MLNESFIEFSQLLYTAIESELIYPNLVTLTLTRTGDLDSYSEVELQLTGGSAQEGTDYASLFGYPVQKTLL